MRILENQISKRLNVPMSFTKQSLGHKFKGSIVQRSARGLWQSLPTSVCWVPFQTLPGWPHPPSLPKLDILSTSPLSLSEPQKSQANTSQTCPGLPKPAQAYPHLPEHAQACPLACPCLALHASPLGMVPFFNKVQAGCAN